MGEVRTRADGQMEFRDAENPEWSKSMHIQHVHIEANENEALAAYHSQYRRQFLDEAAEQGGFGKLVFGPHVEMVTEQSFQSTSQLEVRPRMTRRASKSSSRPGVRPKRTGTTSPTLEEER